MINNHNHKCAHECDDQLPAFTKASRGLRGDSYTIEVTDDENAQNLTYLTAKKYDAITKTSTEVWRSDNINGGRLQCFYHLNEQTVPHSFNLTFVYTRPKTPGKADAHERTRWAFTTPSIPYILEGKTPMMGSIVGTIFLKDHQFSDGGTAENDKYKEMLTYPEVVGEDIRDNFNAPYPPGGRNKISGTTRQGDKPEANNSTHMPHGTEWNAYLDLTEFDEFCTVVGISRTKMINVLNEIEGQFTPPSGDQEWSSDFGDIASDNIKDYIDDMMKRENRKRHDEINRLENRIRNLEAIISSLEGAYDDVIEAILGKFYKGGTLTTTEQSIEPGPIPTKIHTKSVSFPTNDKAAIGNLNVFSNPGSDTKQYKLLTRAEDSKGDLKFK